MRRALAPGARVRRPDRESSDPLQVHVQPTGPTAASDRRRHGTRKNPQKGRRTHPLVNGGNAT